MTLYLTPVVYVYMAAILDWWRGPQQPKRPLTEVPRRPQHVQAA